MFSENNFKKAVMITFYTFIAVTVTYIFIKYMLGILLPFITAILGAYLTRKVILKMDKRLRFKRSFSAFILTFVITGLVVGLLFLLIQSILRELLTLSARLNENSISNFLTGLKNGLTAVLKQFFPRLFHKILPTIQNITDNLNIILTPLTQYTLPHIIKAIMDLFGYIPLFFFFCGITFLAMYYFQKDYEKISAFIKNQMSEKKLSFLKEIKSQFLTTVTGILRGYLILIAMTFTQLLIGFLIIGIPYAVVLAVIISLIDILPVLGTGTVLIPWSIILFFTGNVKTALCIFVLYVIISVIRQISEPKILGGSVGLHPVITLFTMYIGWMFAGFIGILLFPMITIIIKNLNEKGVIRLYKNPQQPKEEQYANKRKGKITH